MGLFEVIMSILHGKSYEPVKFFHTWFVREVAGVFTPGFYELFFGRVFFLESSQKLKMTESPDSIRVGFPAFEQGGRYGCGFHGCFSAVAIASLHTFASSSSDMGLRDCLSSIFLNVLTMGLLGFDIIFSFIVVRMLW